MQKSIKRYICIIAILGTMMGYAQTTNGGALNEVVVRANAADLAYRAWLQQIEDGQGQRAMAEAVAKLKAEALARAEAIAIADAQAQGGSPASSTAKYGEKPMTKKQFDAYRQVLIDEKFGFKYKANYVVTTSDGKKHTGTIFILTDKKGHDMHYFTPNSSDGRYTVGMYYRITNYQSSSATTTGGSGSPGSTGTTTTPFTYDASGFPTGQANYINESGVSAGITILPNTSPVTVISTAQITYTWYMDFDGDGYHSYTQDKARHPGTFWNSSTKGLDCDDKDATKTTDCSGNLPLKGWFLDNDRDGYFAEVQTSTTKPTTPGNWTDVMTKGPDCNDAVASADNSVCSVATPTPCTNKTVCSAGYSLVKCECVPDVPPDPCETLKKLNEDIKYKEKLAFVIEKAKTDSTKEYGYCIAKGASDYEAGTNDSFGDLDFPNDSELYGIIHDHTSPRRTIDANGNPETKKFIQMFSREDLRTFVMMLNNTASNGAAIADVFFYFL
ncbi:hypothetical protein [Flavobacterium piscis]|uniref:DUF4329 domain-containing protein n=1 Tax=Flavobacterium piscis TaxID=1114874 RepID=A0ABU1YBN4_9FLAO|nr:hypothetical protein [Flavobacterium piscis]MDR7211650.1 hypothetical protein [Flavobacterium piscis]